jgi:hypothetical protein
MTKDTRLKGPAQSAIDFIVSAQDPAGGGWRYEPRQRGDTTVTGWQIMALKSAQSAGLAVPEMTIRQASRFLDSMQTEGGAKYGYDTPAGTPALSAIGLLCRVYFGWTRETPPLRAGVDYLSQVGPLPNEIYFNYYAAQVLRHFGGPKWTKWNEVLRERLVNTQIQEGKGAGSWSPAGDRGAATGGRLYQTTMSVMTLEVYYRYMPLYR